MPAGRMRALGRALSVLAVVGIALTNAALVPSAHAEDRDIDMRISASAGIIAPGTDVPVSVEAVNPSDFPTESGEVRVALTSKPLGNAEAVETWLAGIGTPGTAVAMTKALPIPAQGTTSTQLTIPAGVLSVEGTWGVDVALSVGGNHVSRRTVVAVRTQVIPATVATIFALSSASPAVGLYDGASLEKLFESGSPLQSALNAMAGQPVSVGIDPRLIASIRALGDQAPSVATDWLARLEASGLDDFALQYADADPVVELRAGYPGLLTPGFADLHLSPEELGQLTSWTYSRSLLWPRAGGLSPADLSAFTQSNASPVVAYSDSVSDASRPAAVVANSALVIAQRAPSSALTRALESSNSVDWRNANNVLQAELAFFGGQQIVLAPDRAVIADSLRASATLTTLAQSSVSRAISIGSLTQSGTVTLTSTAPDVQLTADAAHVRSRADTLQSFANIAVHPVELQDPITRDVLALLSAPLAADPEGRQQAIAAFDAQLSTVFNSVRVATSSVINVLASEASLPFTIQNDLPTAIAVRVTVAPSNGRLRVGESIQTEIAAGSRQTVRVPVTAKIGNGSVALKVSVVDRQGALVTEPVIVSANVQADWEGWGATIFGLATLSLLGLGIVRQVRKVRRQRREDANGQL